MRITIGHVLIIAGLGGYLATGPLKTTDTSQIKEKAKSMRSNIGSLMDLFKSGIQSIVPASDGKSEKTSQPNPNIDEKLPELELLPGTDVSQGSEPLNTEGPQTTAVPGPAPPGEEKIQRPVEPKPTTVKKPSKRTTVKKSKSRGKKSPKDPLIGTYVSLVLKSGREVKGILKSRTPETYIIQLPGMGPFTYKADTVVRMEPAK